ncbi:MAG: FAD:protein FMN transferase [bacterium]|nr:FAD:protein FMN transferase [bacterium]
MSGLDARDGGYAPIVRRMIVPAIFVGALFAVYLWRSPGGEPSREVAVLSGQALGTTYAVKVVAEGGLAVGQSESLELEIEETLAAIDASMSTWREDSELERFNRHGTEPFLLSPALDEVMAKALEIGSRSGGAFDITVGPLVEAWGFGPEAESREPSPERIAELLGQTGSHRLTLDRQGRTLRKNAGRIRCDLSAIAKGYAVDKLAAALAGTGYSDFMIELGGEVMVRGVNATGEDWRIGIEVPDPERRAVYAVVALDGRALATSGNYRNFRIEDGRVVSHIIDPRTGRPVTHTLASVSVIAETCMEADAWATALSVLGPDEGLEAARREGLAALFIAHHPDGELEETSTAAFDRFRALHSTGENTS